MSKMNKSITVNLGNYQTLRMEVIEANSFEECDILLKAEISRLNIVNFQHAGVR